jgi:EthD domain
MVRLTALLRRNPALTHEEFVAHWRDVHGPLIASVPGIERWVVRYEQHPRAAGAAGAWTGTEGIDGMTLQWFRSIDDLMAMISDPEYRRMVGPDERHLVDLDNSVYLLSEEPRMVIGDG